MSDRALAVSEPDDEAQKKRLDRDADLLGRRPSGARSPSPIRQHLDDIYTQVQKGFEDQSRRSDELQDYWDCYNCDPNGNRYYNGIADIYVPIIHDGVEACVTRWVNQMFPQAGRYLETVASDGSSKNALLALLDHYIREARFKTQVAAPLCRNMIIEGHGNLYTDWGEQEREIVSRETHGPRDPETGVEAPGEPIEDVTTETVRVGMPVFEVLHDCDVLVLPSTADSVDEALQGGGVVAILRRWSKTKLEKLAKAGVIRSDEAKILKEEMAQSSRGMGQKNLEKHILDHVGIKPGGKEVDVWEVWHMLPLGEDGRFSEDGDPRLCRIFFGPGRMQLGAKRNPYWNDRCPLNSAPLKKMAGVFKGPSPIAYVDSLQYEANDAMNEGADAATLSAAPIITRDTKESNAPLVYANGAIWDVPPSAIKLLEFPDLTPRALTRVQMAIAAIFQTLSVNPSMLPQQTRTSKPNQAQIAQEQAVDLLTTAEAVTVMEEGIFTPAMAQTVDLDYQFRDKPLLVRMFGEMGHQAVMEEVPPLANRNGLTFIWRGGNQARQSAMLMQSGIAGLNVLKDPALAQSLAAAGFKVNLAPLVEAIAQNMFGPEIAGRVLIDQRSQMSWDPEEENEAMMTGFEVPVHPEDDDIKHMQAHIPMVALDPSGRVQLHVQAHARQRQQKAMAMAMQQVQQAIAQGAPQQAQPGGAPRAPQPGAQPAGPRQMKGPPGMVPPDRIPMMGGITMPRRN